MPAKILDNNMSRPVSHSLGRAQLMDAVCGKALCCSWQKSNMDWNTIRAQLVRPSIRSPYAYPDYRLMCIRPSPTRSRLIFITEWYYWAHTARPMRIHIDFIFFFAHISQNEIINVSKDPVRPPYMVVYNTFGASAKNERHTPKRNSNLFLGYPLTAQTMGSKKYDVPFQRIRILWLSRLHHSCGMAVCGVCVLMYLDTCHTRRYVRYFVTGTGGQLVSDEQKHEWFVLIFRFVWDNCALANVGLRFGIGFGMITTNIYL